MSTFSRRGVVAAVAAATTAAVSGCGTRTASNGSAPRRNSGVDAEKPKGAQPLRLIGDGSMADTGPQPFQPAAERMEPGQRPPQFVVFSWDGAGEDKKQLFSHFRAVAQEVKATMSFFLSGIYVLPEGKKDLYLPPGHKPGASDIGYLADDHVKATLEQVRLAWLEGHEIGTHFNGHFCSPTSGVGTWSPAQWRSELEQAVGFVANWKTNTGYHDMDPLPFDYARELIGGRTPCLLGQNQLLPTAAAMGWKYDASSPGGLQMWPSKKLGLWDFPLQSIPFPGHSFQVLSMDYNMLANQTGGTPNGDPSMRPYWQQQSYLSYMAGFNRAYTTNRAPFFVGNHFESWNGGIYMKSVERALRDIAAHPDVRLVSFRQLVQWLEAQDPVVLDRLRTLVPGQTPGDWRDYTDVPSARRPAAQPQGGRVVAQT
ncbi:hypothetical protein [Streptacidiphilus neutrinimicus]|uniref:hypothetical protein n=1 Tax=Streptacidiphilus neutrinimicus TaxID=105420 RepID=UPI0007C76E31|nr:hypothetical protein [Streptacidiphilus neutrinimicus]